MLPAPSPTQQLHPAYAPILAMCQTVLVTAQEAAKHLRYHPHHLHNMRSSKAGPAWLKLGENGAVRYRLSELLAWEIAGHRGALTLERVSLALATVPGMTVEMRQKIDAHLQAVLGANANRAPNV